MNTEEISAQSVRAGETEERPQFPPQAQAHTHEHAQENTQAHSHPHEHTQAVLHRLSRAIGHLESVRRMVEEGRDCADVLLQLAAVRGALNAVSRIVLKDHMDHCIADAVERGDGAALEELRRAIDRMITQS